ncbi:hypothetical protein [Chitinasiproducens palmae]|uniref:Uncharacterized protein n=1 Tax=Chitinasiproducens palmae TaxID=1770053 RepID=A0A1H2PS73_9BURK|nr:hypothetical protein [Chitinasiproducens palmae]SDV49799.1 hypothetical protein SAMN05216551_109146 [Chitinasiproducens palmae]
MKRWTEEEVKALRWAYSQPASIKRNLHLFGGRSLRTVMVKAHNLGLKKCRPGSGSMAWDQVCDAMKDGVPRSIEAAAALVGVTRGAMALLVWRRVKLNDAHVTGWVNQVDGGAPALLFVPRPGKSVPRPRAATSKERHKRRVRKVGRAELAAQQQLYRARRRALTARPRRDALTAAFYGKGAQ